jgi:hypothetical protein
MENDSKGLQLILRLTKATVLKEIEWKTADAPKSLTTGTDCLFPVYVETSYKGQCIALFERRCRSYDGERDSFYWTGSNAVALLDDGRRIVWEFDEPSVALDLLLKTARESAANVEQLLDSLLS